MKKVQRLNVILAFVLVITLLLPLVEVSAKTNRVTDAQLKKVMKCYKNILATNPYEDIEGAGFKATTFLLKDLDKNGVPELIINGEVPQIFSYDLKTDEETWIFDSWVYNTLYYSSKTKNIMYSYEWKGKKEWSFFKVNNMQEIEDSSETRMIEFLDDSYSYTDGKYEKGDECKAKKGYYKGSYFEDKAKKISKKKVEAAFNKLVPDKVELKTTIKNTKANRNKYLGNLKKFKMQK